MPSTQAVAAAIQAAITPAITELVVDNNPVEAQIAVGWPPLKVLQNNVKGTTAIVTIYDRKMAKNSTRWKPMQLGNTTFPCNLVSTVSNTSIAPSGSVTITLSQTPNIGDAVSAVIQNSSFLSQAVPNGQILTNSAAQVVIAQKNDTPSTLAAALAAAINADPVMSLWIHATVSGAVITIHSLVSRASLTLNSYTGNGGTTNKEIGRRERNYQVVVWTPTSDIRTAIITALEETLQGIETNNWLQFTDGTQGRLFNQNDYDLEDDTLQDTYRHDFLFSVEYPITEQDELYSVLAPIAQYQL